MAKHLLRFDRRDLSVTGAADGVAVVLADGQYPGRPGAPALPGRLLHVAVAAGRTPTRATARVLSAEVVLDGPVHVRPQSTRGIGSLAIDKPTAPRVRAVDPDPALYAAAASDPLVEVRGTTWMGNVQVVSIFVRPVRLTDTGDLELVTSLEVDLSTRADRKQAVRRAVAQRAHARSIRYQDLAARVVINPEAVPIASPPRATGKVSAGGGGAGGGTASGGASGPPLPGLAAVPDGAGPRDVDYLVIAADEAWDAMSITPGAALPGMVAAFAPLIAHKAGRGLRGHVARVRDIVAGAYGDHRTGARDLQEVLRRFLQAYVRARGVEWVVLGGDVGVVPVRQVCGSDAYGVFGAATSVGGPVVPKVGEYLWKTNYLALRLADDVATNPGQFGQQGHILTMFTSGTRVPWVAAPGGNSLCWFYTDSTWTTASATPTPYARVNGPAAVINDQPQWYTDDNLVPTDLYYASLYADTYLRPGRHDWDLLDNGLYGQWSATANLDGVDYGTDVSVGRVPAASAAEVTRWVDKLIAYERAGERPQDHARFRKMLYVAEHWGGWARLGRGAGDPSPPAAWTYSRATGASRSLLHGPDLDVWPFGELLAYVGAGNRRRIPYGTGAVARSWYYAVSATDLTPSQVIFCLPLLGTVEAPLRSEHIVVRSDQPDELTPMHYVYDTEGLDGSIADIERVRKLLRSSRPRIDDVQRLYSDEDDLSAVDAAAAPVAYLTDARLLAELNEGPHFVVLSGHGNSPGCCRFFSWIVPNLTNAGRTFIVHADSCLTAQFNVEDCLGEVLLCHTSDGGVAYVGNSRFSWIGIGCEFQYDFFAQLGTQRHLGLLLDVGRRLWTGGRYHRWAVYAQNLLGCPEMPVYRDDLDARQLWIGNAGSKELHERFCPWVKAMSTRNMRQFVDKAAALAAGYDGCGFCMREHHTR